MTARSTKMRWLGALALLIIAVASNRALSRDPPIYGSPGPACRDSCAARCMALRCPNQTEAACLRERMACRSQCSTRC